jgi:tetratricopeptide (TPR) repeat protein
MTGAGDTLMAMLEPSQRPGREPPMEILAERTRPDAPSALITAVGPQARAAPRLVVTAGPGKGAEFALLDPLTTLGRAAGSGVALADLSVSRRHSRLEKKGTRWILFDEGSGNGTGVNGRPVVRRALRHGDEVALGDTRLRFLEAEGVIAWNEGASRVFCPRARFPWAAAALAAVALAAGLAAFRLRKERAQAEARDGALREAARAAARQGDALGKLGKLAEARDRLRAAAELDPADPGIAAALRAAEDAVASVEAARAASGAPDVPAPPAAPPAPPAASATRPIAGEAAGARSGRPGREASQAIALRHLQLARQLPGDDVVPQAAAHLRAALRSDPANAEARALLERLAGRSREMYLRAYLAKEGDPALARRMFALVAEALPDGDETGAKARRWLARLQGKAGP